MNAVINRSNNNDNEFRRLREKMNLNFINDKAENMSLTTMIKILNLYFSVYLIYVFSFASLSILSFNRLGYIFVLGIDKDKVQIQPSLLNELAGWLSQAGRQADRQINK